MVQLLSIIRSLKTWYDKNHNLVLIGTIILFIMYIRCDREEGTKDVIEKQRVPIESVTMLPTPKKKVISVKRQRQPTTYTHSVDTLTSIKKDTIEDIAVNVYEGKHTINVNKLPAIIPYEVTTTGELVDLKLGLDYSSLIRYREPKLSIYALAGIDINLQPNIGGSIVTRKYQFNYTYQPINKVHNVTLGIRLLKF